MARAVVANADGAQPIVDPDIAEYQRSAVSALMDHDGVVPDGSVGDELLVRDPSAPFGLRIDATAAFDAFERSWQSRSVVLVEASDVFRARSLRRVHHHRPAAGAQGRALRDTDALVGRMLEQVDPRVMRWSSSGRRRRGADRV